MPVVAMRGITKTFPGIRANDGIDLDLEPGTIHALLGENGAGKSTLMGILFGLHQPDSGSITVRSKEVRIASPATATALGIGMVHQHFTLVENFTVTENIILGQEPRKGLFIDKTRAAQEVQALSERYKLQIDPRAKIEDISVGMRQRVEILKMLYRNADILIFDEPTAVLTPQEIRDLMGIMKALAGEGKSLVMITHKLKEIIEIADSCTVLRRGRTIGSVKVSESNAQQLAEMMIGREWAGAIQKSAGKTGKPLLEIEHLNVRSAKGTLSVQNLSLTVHAGEILGLCGIDGNGQTELIHAIAGLLPVESGHIILTQQGQKLDITHWPPKKRYEAGLGHIPEDRQKHGLVLDFQLDENLVLHTFDRPPYSSGGLLKRETICKHAHYLIPAYDLRGGQIKSQGAAALVRHLSGGNQQKVILARELNRSPSLLVVAQPTRGLDVGAIESLHQRLLVERDKGKAILLASLELDEILALSDRIAVMHGGKITGVVEAAKTNENALGLLMGGA